MDEQRVREIVREEIRKAAAFISGGIDHTKKLPMIGDTEKEVVVALDGKSFARLIAPSLNCKGGPGDEP